jgi:hypothetical protein
MSLSLLSVKPEVQALVDEQGLVRAYQPRFTTGGPMSRVLRAIIGGGRTDAQLSAMTGLDEDLIQTIIERLVSTGRLSRKQLAYGCPGGSCGSCQIACECHSPAKD